MQFKSKLHLFIFSILLMAGLILLDACSKNHSQKEKVVFTQVPVSVTDVLQINTIKSKYLSSMNIAMAEMGEGLHQVDNLTSEFNSARSPEISFDGTTMVFSGQKEDGDPWQIWKMNLETRDVYQVTESRTNCTDPSWLPNGNIVFSKLVTDDKALKYHALHTINSDGCCEERITYQPHEDINANVLHDGRIIVASRQVFPEPGPFKYLALRPDGTKAEAFYLANNKSDKLGKAIENEDGLVLFSEQDIMKSINFNRPLHTVESIEHETGAFVNSIFLYDEDALLLSIKKREAKSYGLTLISPNAPDKAGFYYTDPDNHILEAVVIKSRTIPRKLPSRVNPELNTGYFFSMNADASEIKAKGKTHKVQVLGMNEVIGEASVAEDGSFYLNLVSDRPIRFQTFDEEGALLRGPSSWMWVRPNERRGCVGCHQDREVSPENIVPKALEKAPISMIR